MAAESLQQNGYAGQTAVSPAPEANQNAELAKEEVGWYFVERYYNTLSKSPEKLYLLYNKRSQFVAGVEEEKVHVSIGLKAIDDRVKELNYQDCKVRITNVDSQSSDVNIVVQVIGEMTNEAKPHRKFCQTFVLAPQPHGYFLLNDILRFIADDDDEPLDAPAETEPAENHATMEQPAPSAVEPEADTLPTQDPIVSEPSSKSVEPLAVNGHTDHNGDLTTAAAGEQEADEEQSASIVDFKENEPVAEAQKPAITEAKETKLSANTAAPAPAAPAPAPSKPAVPLSWAQRIGAGNSSKSAAPATAAAPSAGNAVSISAPASKSTAPIAPANKPVAAQPEPASQTTVRQASPANSAQDGSQGGWQTAGVDHGKAKSRTNAPATEGGHVRAYVKNVFQSVTTEALKAELSKYGELAYFDVNRQKNSAFIEFSSVEAFKACIADNPHQIGEDSIIVEERRLASSFAHRGNNRGGRGGAFDGRQGSARGGLNGKDGGGPPRGQFSGPRGNRGGANGVAGRGRPQAAV